MERLDEGMTMDKLKEAGTYVFWILLAAVVLILLSRVAGCGVSEGDTGTGEAKSQHVLPIKLVARVQEIPSYPGSSEEETGEEESNEEVEEEESSEAQPNSGGKDPVSEPSPTNHPSPQPPEEPKPDSKPELQPPANHDPGGGTKPPVATQPPSLPPPPPKPPEESGIALCAPTPVMRGNGTMGIYWQASASQVPGLLKAGYKPAIYVEGEGTSCSLAEAHVNPNDYVLDPSVLYTDGGMSCPVSAALAMCGDSAIHQFYRKK